MEFRLLRSFLVVAEELNIGRAAKRLFIAQPPLSKQIQQLENELGVTLFERIPRGLKLTPEGEVLVKEAKKIHLMVEQAAVAVSKVHQGASGSLNIGFSGALPSSILPKMLLKAKNFYPNVGFQIQRMANSNIVLEAVANGDLDAGLVLLPISNVGISKKVLSKHKLVAVLPKDHALAKLEKIEIQQIANESFIANLPFKGSVIREVFKAACHAAGFNPKITQEVDDTYTIIMLVAAKFGITITLEGIENLHLDEVVYIPLADNTTAIELAIVWRQGNPSLLLENILKIF